MTYTQLIELVIMRQIGIVGLKNTMDILRESGLAVGDDFRLVGKGGHDDLEKLMIKFKVKYGLVTVMGCKIAVGRKAREWNLALPQILK
jgi:hypothetical protein